MLHQAPTISFTREAPKLTQGWSMSQPKVEPPKPKVYRGAEPTSSKPAKVLNWFAKTQANRQ